MRLIALAALLAVCCFTTSAAQPNGRNTDEIVDKGRDTCERVDGGSFTLLDGAVSEIDLDGDGAPDRVVEEAKFSCTSAASLYCGTGGCAVHFIVGDQVSTYFARGWRLVEWGRDRLILLDIHGTACGGTNLRRCYEAVVWSEGGFKGVRTPRE